jgi:GxxExxY protein
MGYTFEALSGKIIAAAIDAHRKLGPGFLESVYESALRVALRHRGIVHESQKEVTIVYEDEEVGVHRLDLLVEEQIIVELKAVEAFENLHFAQVKSYLKATHRSIGLLLNFNAPTLVIKRVVLADGQTGYDSSDWVSEQEHFSPEN